MWIPALAPVTGRASSGSASRTAYPYQQLVPPLVLLGAVAGYVVVGTPLGAAIGVALPLSVGLTWRGGVAPVFPLALALQWVQVSSGHLYQGLTGRWLLATSHPATEQATYLGLAALVALATGMRLGMGSRTRADLSAASDVAADPPTPRLLATVAGVVVLGPILSAIAWRLPAITQPLNALLMVKWVLFYILFVRTLRSGQKRAWAVALLAIEVFLGFTSFFSSWKVPLFVLMLVLLTADRRLPMKKIFAAVSLALAGFCLAVLWLDIRESIRGELSGGSEKGRAEILSGALDASSLLIGGKESVADRVDFLIERASYVYYFSHVVARIPSRRPYEGGRLHTAALRHVLMPRLLFPAKPPLPNDSWYVAEFAGIRVPVVEGGTSISIGYAAEGYADLGPVWMFVPLLLFGTLVGLMARALMRLPLQTVTVNGLLVATLFFHLHLFEMTLVKMLGGQLTAFIFLYVSARLFGRSLEQWLAGGPRPPRWARPA